MPANSNLFLIFLTGLTTGGLSCLAVQGGLLASVISPTEEKINRKLQTQNQALPILAFLISKLIAYTILGALLGLLGTVITLSPITRGWFQIAIAIYLLGVALSMLEVHPIFRYFIITPPKFLSRLIKDQSKSKSIFAPAVLGAMTVFIPCAVTQATEAIALATANPLYGAAVMAAFILGTSPTFFALGFVFTRAGSHFQSWFGKVSAALLIVMAVTTFNGGLGLMGSIYTIQNFYEAAKISLNSSAPRVAGASATISGDVQEINIAVRSSGYTPQSIILKKGIKTRLTLTTNNTGGCARAFTIPSLRLSKILPETGTETLEFTPTKTGPLVFACSMGMYTGTFNVI